MDTTADMVHEREVVPGRLHHCASFGALGHGAGPGHLAATPSSCQGYKQTRQIGSEAEEGDKLARGGENFLTREDPEALQRAWAGERGLQPTTKASPWPTQSCSVCVYDPLGDTKEASRYDASPPPPPRTPLTPTPLASLRTPSPSPLPLSPLFPSPTPSSLHSPASSPAPLPSSQH